MQRSFLASEASLGPTVTKHHAGASMVQGANATAMMRVLEGPPAGCRDFSSSSGVLLGCQGESRGIGNVSSFSVPLQGLSMGDGLQVNVNLTVNALLDTDGQRCETNCTPELNSRLQMNVGFGSTETPCAGPSGESPFGVNTTVAASLLCFPEAGRSDLSVNIHSNEAMGFDVSVWLEKKKHANGNQTLRTSFGGNKGAATMLAFKINKMEGAGSSSLARVVFQVKSRGNYSGYHPPDTSHYHHSGPEQLRYLNDVVQGFVNGTRNATGLPPETSAYLFHESSGCIADLIARGGCANPDEVSSCFGGSWAGSNHNWAPRLAHRVTFLEGAWLTLSEGSAPALAPGRWFVLLTCQTHTWRDHSVGLPGIGCPETEISVNWNLEANTGWKLWHGFLLMLLAPGLLLLSSSVARFLLGAVMTYLAPTMLEVQGFVPNHPLAQGLSYYQELLQLFGQRFWEMARNPQPRFAALLLLMAGVFCTTALQFVITYWAMSLHTANRNTCYYNYECYYPFFGFDLPVNNMISHVAYFLAGMHIILCTISTEHRCSLQVTEGATPIDLSVFYALGVSVLCEGIGSMAYHLCPSVATFQFDTAFMLPIAHMSMCALEDWRWEAPPAPKPKAPGDCANADAEAAGSEPSGDMSAPFRYFLYVICPIWFFNFIGTWYDVDMMSKWVYYCVLVCVVAFWAFNALSVIRRFLGIDFTSLVGMCGQAVLQAYFALGLAAVLMLDVVRDHLGGTANIFLLISTVAMFLVVFVQWVSLDLVYAFQRIRRSSWCGVPGLLWMLLENLPVAVFVVATVIALRYFHHKTAIIAPRTSSAVSRESNEPCVLMQVFDQHDMWHFLSAVALAFWAMALLDTKVRIHLRKQGATLAEAQPRTAKRPPGPQLLPW